MSYNIKVLILSLAMIASVNSFSAQLAVDAEITRIANSGNNKEDFYIYVSGGTGLCQNTAILFPKSIAVSDEYFNRAFSIALSAFMSGNKKVQVSGFYGNDCHKASLIELQK